MRMLYPLLFGSSGIILKNILILFNRSFDYPKYTQAGLQEDSQPFTNYSYFIVIFQVFIMLGSLLLFILWIFTSILQYNRQADIFINVKLADVELLWIKDSLNKQTNIQAMQESLVGIPWIKHAVISKQIGVQKSIIMVNIEKAVPLGQLENKQLVFDNKGSFTFIAYKDSKGRDFFDNVPLIKGSFKTYDPKISIKSAVIVRLSEILLAAGIVINEYSLSHNGALSVNIEEGKIIKLGINDYNERLARLEKFLDIHKNQLVNINEIDLRHNRALAVSYKS